MRKQWTIRLKPFPISGLADVKAIAAILLLTLLCLVLTVFSVGTGEVTIPPLEVLKTLVGLGSPGDELIVHTLRLPRTLTALLVGAALAVAGAVLQGIIRNPLASPDIVGITGGASVTAVAFLSLFAHLGIQWLPVAAFVGGSLTALMIYGLAWKQGVSPLRLVLIGIGINAVAGGLTTLLLILSPIYTTGQAVVWLSGSVYASSWSTVWTLLSWVGILIPVSFFTARHLNAQQMGDAVATGIGSRVQRYRFFLTLLSVGLASAAVAASGPIGFVGLMAPHIARMWVGPAAGQLLPVAGLTGSLLVLTADFIGRTAFSPLDLPAGLFTAVLGAPFLIYLLFRYGRTV